ncbi:hypothetical protein H4Q26_002952 [Puccinia striiformis f. sp. tritici PST-130]|nr:hypothetical protein H4Q26_002952 [Puccinia striiformis f. sp. tritici PST-130]
MPQLDTSPDCDSTGSSNSDCVPVAQSTLIMIDEGPSIMEIDEEEDHSDPPLHESDINELLEANDLQEKQDHSSVQSDGALVVHPALRLGLITNLCKYDYTSGEPLDPPPIPPPLAQSNANKNVYIQCNTSGEFRGQQLNPSGQQTATKKIRCPFEFKASIPTSKKL